MMCILHCSTLAVLKTPRALSHITPLLLLCLVCSMLAALKKMPADVGSAITAAHVDGEFQEIDIGLEINKF
jgi:hypothetical protein